MSRRKKQLKQKSESNTGNWLKYFISKQKPMPKEYTDIINKNFWALLGKNGDI